MVMDEFMSEYIYRYYTYYTIMTLMWWQSLPLTHPLPPAPSVIRVARADQPSGFGFELTFRLQQVDGETIPPKWPAELLQSLARYVFNSENMLCCGDHISWHSPLDRGDSRLQHMLLTQDPQLKATSTSLGGVMFIQVSVNL